MTRIPNLGDTYVTVATQTQTTSQPVSNSR